MSVVRIARSKRRLFIQSSHDPGSGLHGVPMRRTRILAAQSPDSASDPRYPGLCTGTLHPGLHSAFPATANPILEALLPGLAPH